MTPADRWNEKRPVSKRRNRPAPTRPEISEAVRAYLDQGGKITRIESTPESEHEFLSGATESSYNADHWLADGLVRTRGNTWA